MSEIAVIVPVYNVERLINRCVNSILNQTFVDFDLYLIDDGSTDFSGVICDDYAQKDGRVHVFHQSNYGQSVARNYALDWVMKNSTSEWITFVDSDDYVHPKMLEILFNNAETNHADISVCDYKDVHNTISFPDIVMSQLIIENGSDYLVKYFDEPKQKRCWVLWAKLFHRKCFTSIRLPEGRIYEDNATVYKLIFEAVRIVDCDIPLYFYYDNPNSSSRQINEKQIYDWQNATFDMVNYFLGKRNDYLLNRVSSLYMRSTIGILNQYKKKHMKSQMTNKLEKQVKQVYKELHIRKISGIERFPDYFNTLHPFYAWVFWTCRSRIEKLNIWREK